MELSKAYVGTDGKARLFRPELNVARLANSAARVALPVSAEFVKEFDQFDDALWSLSTNKPCLP